MECAAPSPNLGRFLFGEQVAFFLLLNVQTGVFVYIVTFQTFLSKQKKYE